MGFSRLKRASGGRVPYSLVGIVVLASMLLLSSYLAIVSSYQNLETSNDIPQMTQAAVVEVEGEMEQAAHFDLMNATAQILASSSFGSGNSAPLDTLNASVNAQFTSSLRSLGLVGSGLTLGTTTVTVTGWGINVTYAQGQVLDSVDSVTLTGTVTNPYLTLPTSASSQYPGSLALTQENVYPMVVINASMLAVDTAAGSTELVPYTFTTSLQSDIGLLESKAAEFSDASYGSNGGFAHLVQYIATTIAELRALAGFGSGGYPGPHATTDVAATNSPSVLSQADVRNATSLAILLESLQYFRSYDPGAVTSLLSGLPPGAYQTLLERYVANGTVDSAALFLLLVNNTNSPYGLGAISTGEGLSQAIYSFADRFKYDLLAKFWGPYVMDPTLLEPVSSWPTVRSAGTTYAINRLSQWLWDYGTWLGVTQHSLPAYDSTAAIPPMVGYSNGGNCEYILFPGGSIETSNPGVPDLVNLILGTANAEDVTLPNGNTIRVYLAPDNYQVWENVTVTDPYGQNNWIDFNENATFITTSQSLLWLFNPGESSFYDPAAYDRTLHSIIVDTSNSIGQKSATPTDVTNKGYMDYMAYQGYKGGNNYSLASAGLPDLNTTTGRNTALNTSYSLLTNGSSTLLRGPYSTAIGNFGTNVSNPNTVNSWWINGASHPGLMGAGDPPTNDAANNWTMSAVSSYGAREWFQMLWTLWYGSGGGLPNVAPPLNTINYNNMDANQYNVLTPGVERSPPPAYNEPNFAVNVMNETFISVYCWITGIGTGIGCANEDGAGFGGYYFCPTGPGWGNTWRTGCEGGTANFNGGSPYVQGACGFGDAYAAYLNAMNRYYYPGTGLNRMWNLVGGAVLLSLHNGIDQIHGLLQSSWSSIYNYTGDASWGGTNFTNWILAFIAPPVLNDTRNLTGSGPSGGWLPELFNSTLTWLLAGNNLTSTVDKPWLDRNLPYTFSWGNTTAAGANSALFSESLSGMYLRVGTGTLSWTPPATTVHLVDPQDTANNMGMAPFLTTWQIEVNGQASVELNGTRGSFGGGGDILPTQLNLTIPLDFTVNVTVYTPWPLLSGWHPSQWPAPPDPLIVETRGLLGIVGRDFHPTPPFLPGVYVSHLLDALFLSSAAGGRISGTEGALLANLMSGLPDKAVGGSAAFSQNLTVLENATNADLAATAGAYLTSTQTLMNGLIAQLNAGPQGPLPTTLSGHYGANNAYFGYNFLSDLPSECLSYFNAPADPSGCGNTFPVYTPSIYYSMAFTGPRVSYSFQVDAPHTGLPPVPMVHGFTGSWSPTGSYALQAGWQEFSTPYSLSLSGPYSPSTATGIGTSYPGLSVPFRGPAVTLPASLSAWGVGGIPQAASSAFQRSVSDWLPYPGVFEDYVSQELYAAGYLYDNLTGPNPATLNGVTSFGYSTNLQFPGAHSENYSLEVENEAGLFGNRATRNVTMAFLLWLEQNDRALAYGLGAPSTDRTVLSTADPVVLSQVFRNVTYESGAPGSPWLSAWLSGNIAFEEADLGGASGGLNNAPAAYIGGWTSGGFDLSGTLTIA